MLVYGTRKREKRALLTYKRQTNNYKPKSRGYFDRPRIQEANKPEKKWRVDYILDGGIKERTNEGRQRNHTPETTRQDIRTW